MGTTKVIVILSMITAVCCFTIHSNGHLVNSRDQKPGDLKWTPLEKLTKSNLRAEDNRSQIGIGNNMTSDVWIKLSFEQQLLFNQAGALQTLSKYGTFWFKQPGLGFSRLMPSNYIVSYLAPSDPVRVSVTANDGKPILDSVPVTPPIAILVKEDGSVRIQN